MTLATKKSTKSKETVSNGKKAAKAAPVEEDATLQSKRKRTVEITEEVEKDSPKKSKRTRTVTEPKTERKKSKQEAEDQEDEEEEEEENINLEDKQALALAFDSDSEEDEEDEEGGVALDTIPKISAKIQKEVAKVKAKSSSSDIPAVLYLGRIPHGFYEHQMRQYFSQFGNITRLRLCRNKKTGRSKHFGFIEFESAEVADIVARAMHNYLLFGHILQVKLVPAESVHEDLFKGANKRFKKVPWGDINARALKAPATRDTWEKRVAREEQKRKVKQEKLKDLGYDFEIPKVKQVKDLPARSARIEAPSQPAIEAPETSTKTETTVKSVKKGKKTKQAS